MQKSLNGTWMLKEENLSRGVSDYWKVVENEKDWIEAIVPGDIHKDLIDVGKISEPLIGLNSFESLWTEDRSWWYKKTFKTEKQWLECEEVEIELNGLDAMADVFINHEYIGHHISTFRPFLIDVKPFLVKEGKDNLLVIRLTSGLEYFSKYEISEVEPFVHIENIENRGDKRRVYVRKPQYVFGWDWNPRIPSCGITGDVSIRAIKRAVIREVSINILSIDNNKAAIDINLNIEYMNETSTSEGKICIEFVDSENKKARVEKETVIVSGYNYINLNLNINNPHLWWPRGLGEQELYKVKIIAEIDDFEVTYKPFEYGIRTVEIDQSKINKEERLFAIAVNGKKVYCKGGNWVTPDSIYGRVKKEKYVKLINEAIEANFNMIRIWGGGLYEKDYFYDLCDKAGLMIWHDFMFACAAYPDQEQWFKEEIRKEIDFQTKRLRNHPSIILWCGCNENIWFFQFLWNKKTFRGSQIYNKVIPEIIDKNCSNIPYWNSSPYGGKEPNSEKMGNRHIWQEEVIINPQFYDEVDSKFITEYGYIGPSTRNSTKKYLGAENYDLDCREWKHHNNTHEKNIVIAGIQKHYVNTDNLSYDDYLLYGGLCQGMMLEYSLDAFRAHKNCYGGLFWMYNDCWGEVGWSIIDYYINRKISYYFVKRANSDIRMIIRKVKGKYILTIANDKFKDINDDLEFGYISFDGEIKKVGRKNLNINGLTRVFLSVFNQVDYDLEKGCLFAKFSDNKLAPGIYRNYSIRQLKLQKSDLEVIEFEKISKNNSRFVINTNFYAHAVHFNLPSDYLLSDEYFDLLPGGKREITVVGKDLAKNMIKPKSIKV